MRGLNWNTHFKIRTSLATKENKIVKRVNANIFTRTFSSCHDIERKDSKSNGLFSHNILRPYCFNKYIALSESIILCFFRCPDFLPKRGRPLLSTISRLCFLVLRNIWHFIILFILFTCMLFIVHPTWFHYYLWVSIILILFSHYPLQEYPHCLFLIQM